MKLITSVIIVFFSLSLIGQTYEESIELHREAYKEKFLKYEQPPLDAEGLDNISFYEAKSDFQLDCRVEFNANNKEVVTISTYAGNQKQYLKYARFTCPLNQDSIRLIAYKSIKHLRHPVYSKLLFIPFKDLTNGEETYGGGRYIDFPIDHIIDGKAILDLNKAYNPWCAYADGYNCPIPPFDNHLKIKIEAGEKNYTNHD